MGRGFANQVFARSPRLAVGAFCDALRSGLLLLDSGGCPVLSTEGPALDL